jgi:hypothetical protein
MPLCLKPQHKADDPRYSTHPFNPIPKMELLKINCRKEENFTVRNKAG